MQQALSVSAPIAGNQARELPSGRDAQQAMFDAIDEARDHIDLQYFTFADVRLGDWHLSELLIEKMGSRVAVNIVYDAYDFTGHFRVTVRGIAQGRRLRRRVQSAQPAAHSDRAFTE